MVDCGIGWDIAIATIKGVKTTAICRRIQLGFIILTPKDLTPNPLIQGKYKHENKYLEQLRKSIKEHTNPKESKLIDGILTESDAEYLAKKGLIKIDPYTDDITLTEAGQVYFLGEKMKQKKKVLKSLTEKEKEWIMKNRELEEQN